MKEIGNRALGQVGGESEALMMMVVGRGGGGDPSHHGSGHDNQGLPWDVVIVLQPMPLLAATLDLVLRVSLHRFLEQGVLGHLPVLDTELARPSADGCHCARLPPKVTVCFLHLRLGFRVSNFLLSFKNGVDELSLAHLKVHSNVWVGHTDLTVTVNLRIGLGEIVVVIVCVDKKCAQSLCVHRMRDCLVVGGAGRALEVRGNELFLIHCIVPARQERQIKSKNLFVSC
jgi:hypothetical protein